MLRNIFIGCKTAVVMPIDKSTKQNHKSEKLFYAKFLWLKNQIFIQNELGHTVQIKEIEEFLKTAHENFEIFRCGIDTRRYVSLCNSKPWILMTQSPGDRDNYGYVPRPWTLSSGEINWETIKYNLQLIRNDSNHLNLDG